MKNLNSNENNPKLTQVRVKVKSSVPGPEAVVYHIAEIILITDMADVPPGWNYTNKSVILKQEDDTTWELPLSSSQMSYTEGLYGQDHPIQPTAAFFYTPCQNEKLLVPLGFDGNIRELQVNLDGGAYHQIGGYEPSSSSPNRRYGYIYLIEG